MSGTRKFWNVYRQVWQAAHCLSDAALAALPADVREEAIRSAVGPEPEDEELEEDDDDEEEEDDDDEEEEDDDDEEEEDEEEEDEEEEESLS